MKLPDLHRQITEYLRQGLKMPDVEQSALDAQRRIDALGYEWDNERQLWRAPSDRQERNR